MTGVLFLLEWLVPALCTFAGIFIVENVRKPILTGFVADRAPSEILVLIISAQALLKTLITAILALVLGICADRFGIGVSIVIVSLFLALLSIIVYLTRKNPAS